MPTFLLLTSKIEFIVTALIPFTTLSESVLNFLQDSLSERDKGIMIDKNVVLLLCTQVMLVNLDVRSLVIG